MKLTIQEAKDKVAKQNGIKNWLRIPWQDHVFYWDDVIEIYAKSAAQEARELIIDEIANLLENSEFIDAPGSVKSKLLSLKENNYTNKNLNIKKDDCKN